MNKFKYCPEPTLKTGEKLHGFHVLRIEQIPDIRVTAYEIEHIKTGARVLHLHGDDKENLFSIGFRTPPEDSTGIAHILEHSVLAGSEKFPLKDVFNELARGTLQTFINAFTYPDKTIYPVASQVRADFFNLARVYTDLVLKPLLLRATFNQEGHHLEFEDPEKIESNLKISGIVYNEMKGSYSSPDSLMYKAIQENLYPDVTYAFDSGGDPDVIPSLTYEQLKKFHHSYYSPTNARFFLYGDISTEDHLVFLKEMLSGFDHVPVDSHIETQRRWEKPYRKHGLYPIGKEESLEGKTTVNMAWMMAENTDHETVLLLKIVSGALIGSAAGPLRKALIDSNLGEDLSPVTGLEQDLKQVAFAVGLRGTDPDKSERIEKLILETLRKVAETGFEREVIEGVLHRVEFGGKEIVRSRMPYGITLMGRAYHTWLYDGDPMVGLKFPQTIEKIRKKWEEEPRLFQKVVQKWFIDNPHRLLSVMEPSQTYAEEREAAFRKRMSGFKASFLPEKLEDIRSKSLSLRKMQMEPDTPEALSALPRLNLEDIPRSIEKIPTEETTIAGITALQHEIFANGIAYLDIAFDISDIPEDLHSYLPLLGKITAGMGAAGLDYEEMARRITLSTGGLWHNITAGMTTDGKNNWQKLIFRTKALHRNVPDAVSIVSDILTEGDLLDEERMRNLILEAKNNLHSAVIPSGHLFAQMTAAAALSTPAYRDEQWNGRTQLKFLKMISDGFGNRKGELFKKLSRLQKMIFRKERLTLNLTGDSEGIDLITESIKGLAGRLTGGGSQGVPSIPELHSKCYGVAIPAQVCYVAKVFPAPTYSDPLSPTLMVLARQLSSSYLYKHIRVQGGAYGGMSLYDPMCGNFSFLSYRDPHLVDTLKVYDGAASFISGNIIKEEELEKAIIGTIGMLDRPMDPSGRGYTAMIRNFAGLTDQDRQSFRNRVFETSTKTLIEAADRFLAPAVESSSVAVYAAAERLSKANETLSLELEIEALV